MIGLGVMINELAGNKDSVEALKAAIGKTIKSLAVDDALEMKFEDGTGICIFDNGQSCCEHRYMNTDDDLTHFVGAVFQKAEVSPQEDEAKDYGECKECQFLIITTSKGQFTCANYNEHNGYYGGFSIAVRRL